MDTEEDLPPDATDNIEQDSSEASQLAADPAGVENDASAELLFRLSLSFCLDEFKATQFHCIDAHLWRFWLHIERQGISVASTLYGDAFRIHLSHALLLLEHALPHRSHRLLNPPNHPVQNSLAALDGIRRRYMYIGYLTPLAEMKDFRSIARSDRFAFFARWSDDGQTFYFSDNQIHLGKFRDFAKALIQSATSLCDNLMGRWAPSISLEGIKDNFVNTSTGYNFVNDPRNRLRGAYLELSACICTFGARPLVMDEAWMHPASE